MKGKKQGGYAPKVATPADVGKAGGAGVSCSAAKGERPLNPGKQDKSGGFTADGAVGVSGTGAGTAKRTSAVATSTRKTRTGTKSGKDGSMPSGARYSGDSGGGFVPGFGK